MSKMLNWEIRKYMKDIRSEKGKGSEARFYILIKLLLHSNLRLTCFPSVRTLREETGFGFEAISEALKWLVARKAIYVIPYEYRRGLELTAATKDQNVYQLTGVIDLFDKLVPYVYMSPDDKAGVLADLKWMKEHPETQELLGLMEKVDYSGENSTIEKGATESEAHDSRFGKRSTPATESEAGGATESEAKGTKALGTTKGTISSITEDGESIIENDESTVDDNPYSQVEDDVCDNPREHLKGEPTALLGYILKVFPNISMARTSKAKKAAMQKISVGGESYPSLEELTRSSTMFRDFLVARLENFRHYWEDKPQEKSAHPLSTIVYKLQKFDDLPSGENMGGYFAYRKKYSSLHLEAAKSQVTRVDVGSSMPEESTPNF